jgi:hypothetical protein
MFITVKPKDERSPRLIWRLKSDLKRKVKSMTVWEFKQILSSATPSQNFFPRNILLSKGER